MAQNLNPRQRQNLIESVTDAVTGLSQLQNSTLPESPKEMFREQEKIIKKLVEICQGFGATFTDSNPQISAEFREHMTSLVATRDSCGAIASQVNSCSQVQLAELQTLVNFAEIRQKLQHETSERITGILQLLNQVLDSLADVVNPSDFEVKISLKQTNHDSGVYFIGEDNDIEADLIVTAPQGISYKLLAAFYGPNRGIVKQLVARNLSQSHTEATKIALRGLLAGGYAIYCIIIPAASSVNSMPAAISDKGNFDHMVVLAHEQQVVLFVPEIRITKPAQHAKLDKSNPDNFVFEADFGTSWKDFSSIVFGIKDKNIENKDSIFKHSFFEPTASTNSISLKIKPEFVKSLAAGACQGYFEIIYSNQQRRKEVQFEVVGPGGSSPNQDELQRKLDEILSRLDAVPDRIQAIVDARVGTATDEIRRLLHQMKSEQAAQLDKRADGILKVIDNVSKKTGDIENLVQKLIAEQEPKKLKSLLDGIKKEIISNVSQEMSALQNALSSLSTKGDVEGLLATLQEVNKEQEKLMKGLQDVLQEVGKLSEQNRKDIEQQTKDIVGKLRKTYYNRANRLEQLLKAILNNRPAWVSISIPKPGQKISPPTLQVRGSVRGPHPQYIIICAIYARNLLASSQQTVVSGGVRFTSSMDISGLQPGNCTFAAFAIPPGTPFVLPQNLEQSTVFAVAIGVTIDIARDLLELQKLKDNISSEEQELIEIEQQLKILLDNELNNDHKLVQELASFVKPLVSADPKKVFTIAGIAKEVDKNILNLTQGLNKFEKLMDAQVKRLDEREGKIVFREHEDINKLAEQIKNHFLQGNTPTAQQSEACMNAAKWLQTRIEQRNMMLNQVSGKLKGLVDNGLHKLMLPACIKIHRSVTTSPPNTQEMLNAVNELSSLVLGETNRLEDVRKMLSEITYLTKSIDGPSKLRELMNVIVGQAPSQTQ